MFYPSVYWKFSSGAQGVLGRCVQWWAMDDALDMPSRPAGRVPILCFSLVVEVLTRVIMHKVL